MKSERILTPGIYLLYALLLIAVISGKKNYHEDEMYTYGLSNNTVYDNYYMAPEDGSSYAPAAEAFMDYLTVQEGERFSYRNVWKKQALDVHPPLYYALVHTICSFFPGSFSLWYAAAVNLVFGLLNLRLLQGLLEFFVPDRWRRLLALAVYAVLAGVLNTAAFLRMYVLLTFWFLTLGYVLLWRLSERLKKRTFYLLLYLIAAAGVLTQYFMAIFLLGVFVIWAFLCLRKKEWKELLGSACALAAAAVTVIGVFPACLSQIFGGYRGHEVVQNLAGGTSALTRWREFGTLAEAALLGNCGILFLAFLAATGLMRILAARRKRREEDEKVLADAVALPETERPAAVLQGRVRREACALLFIPAVFYFLVAAKAAPFVEERYITPVYPLLYLLLILLLYRLAGEKKAAFACTAALLLLSAANGWRTCSFSYLYRDSTALVQFAEEYSDRDCICIYNGENQWEIQSCFLEMRPYASVTFVDYGTLREGGELPLSEEGAVLFILEGYHEEDILELCAGKLPEASAQQVGNTSYAHVWLVE